MESRRKLRGITVAIIASAAVAASTAIPYHLLDVRAPGELVFSGMSTNIPDEASYLMWSRQHAQGAFLVSNHMTTEPHAKILPNPAWLAVGLIARVTGEPTVVAYHMARTFFAFLYLLVLWILLLRVMPTRNAARISWTVIALGGGLGWLSLLGIHLPTADWMPELWSWPSMLHYPHFALSLLLLATFFILWLDSREKPGVWRPILAGLTLSTLAMVHPYTAGTLVGALAVHFAWFVWRTARDNPAGKSPLLAAINGTPGLIPMFLCALPGFLAISLQAALNPMLAEWAAQNVMPSPPPWEYLLGLALPGLGALTMTIYGLARWRRLSEIEVLFVAWMLVSALLAYADPIVPFARRCVEGVHIAVVSLAVAYLARYKGFSKYGPLILILATTLPAPLYHINSEVRADNPGYVAGDHYRMIDAVRTYARDDAVLADPRTSLFVAADTDARVYVGHAEVSPDFLNKAKKLHVFMNSPTTWLERRQMLTQTGCNWLLGSPYMVDRLATATAGSARDNGLKEYARGDSWVLVGPSND